MAYLEKTKNDIFVSYSHVDNTEDLDGQQCISLIVRQLRSILQQRLSREGVEVFWDASHLKANQALDSTLMDEVAQSAVMVAIVSPGYNSGDYTIAELEAFLKLPGADKRLFIFEVLPASSNDAQHPVLRDRKRFEFWHNTGASGATPMTLDPKLDRQLYMTALTDFCTQLKDQLVLLKRQEQGLEVKETVASADPTATILLAQSTDDLEYQRGQVRSALAQFNIRVLPEMDYPQGGLEFREAFDSDLEQADLVVQLLSNISGRMPADMPDGYMTYQCETAEKAGKALLCWRHPEIDVTRIDNPVHKALVNGPKVMASGLESFKSHILKQVEDQKKEPRLARNSLIFIGADRADMPLAEELLLALSKRGLPVALPIYEGTPEEIQQDLEENLIDSDNVVFVHGDAPTTWVRGFLRRMGRSLAARQSPREYQALIKAPPPKSEGLNHAFPNLDIIDCSDGFDVDHIVSVVESRL